MSDRYILVPIKSRKRPIVAFEPINTDPIFRAFPCEVGNPQGEIEYREDSYEKISGNKPWEEEIVPFSNDKACSSTNDSTVTLSQNQGFCDAENGASECGSQDSLVEIGRTGPEQDQEFLHESEVTDYFESLQ